MSHENTVHRIDKFAVSSDLLPSFLEGVYASHQAIDGLAGMVRNEVLIQSGGEGEFNVVTHVVWVNDESYQNAIAAMSRFHERRGGRPNIDPSVKTDLATYRPTDFRK
jgi:hypothetical protein